MATFYFILNLFLMAAGFYGGHKLGSKEKHVWLLPAVIVTLFIAFLGGISSYPEMEIHLMVWPDYVYFTKTKVAVPVFFMFALGIQQQKIRAINSDDEKLKKSLYSQVRMLNILMVVIFIYIAHSFHWMITKTNYTAEDLPTVWYEGKVCKQTTGWTCAAASLVTYLDRNGVETTQHEMARLALVQPKGGAEDLCIGRALLIKIGDDHDIKIERIEYDSMKDMQMPIMTSTLINFPVYHCINILEWHEDYVIIADSTKGRIKMSRTKFLKKWTNLIIYANKKSG